MWDETCMFWNQRKEMHFPLLPKLDMEVANTRNSLISKWLKKQYKTQHGSVVLASGYAVSLF